MSFYSHAQIPRYQGQGKKKTSGQESGAKVTCTGGGPPPRPELPELGGVSFRGRFLLSVAARDTATVA